MKRIFLLWNLCFVFFVSKTHAQIIKGCDTPYVVPCRPFTSTDLYQVYTRLSDSIHPVYVHNNASGGGGGTTNATIVSPLQRHLAHPPYTGKITSVSVFDTTNWVMNNNNNLLLNQLGTATGSSVSGGIGNTYFYNIGGYWQGGNSRYYAATYAPPCDIHTTSLNVFDSAAYLNSNAMYELIVNNFNNVAQIDSVTGGWGYNVLGYDNNHSAHYLNVNANGSLNVDNSVPISQYKLNYNTATDITMDASAAFVATQLSNLLVNVPNARIINTSVIEVIHYAGGVPDGNVDINVFIYYK